ncbi:hypothetical protein AMIS_2470 [Actinoplanes missouriensis 431]|uniref:Uncharacterized protein n=1 Tax=Actinoplanes missouriensis (strain ATCC 14538 / DSM 43046 / CBS 188.64 / JCM 3121 / NBRC 102363 / NCIMB 12654 / NRRL B-3342 / UNCC 431) TaxID=512565 RepID=I0GXI0_ACTM4|nr:hypothetical protein [Actinoplanes missouriensis]BAL85467.1 hypothetical protein AMIS_2470 [Actinoplanes missouriensis 431]
MNWAEFVEEYVPEPHEITVEALTGAGGFGDVYGSPVVVGPCVVDESTRRVAVQTQDAAGHNDTSGATVLCPRGTTAPAGSRVTLPSGRITRVLAVAVLDAHGLDLPEHVELSLE